MEELAMRVFSHVGRPCSKAEVRNAIQSVHTQHGLSLRWLRLLDKNRNFVAHEGACYVAIDISDPNRWELLIMKDNIIEFDDPTKFFTLTELTTISQSFTNAKTALQHLLTGIFQ